MKVALCFWGLTRSLKYTLHSIKKYILQVFHKHNIEYKIFLHTYYFDTQYINPHACEYNIDLDFEEYKLLKPDFFEIDNQDEIKKNINVLKYRTQNDPWNSGYVCVDNFLCAMYSKKQLGIMVDNCDEKFDNIIYLRPDVKYHTYFDIKYLSMVNKYTICTPNFHLFPKLNDRFCILNNDNLQKYYSLFDKMYEYSLSYPLHSERFQYHIFLNHYKWTIKYIPFLFNRVRANGTELNDIAQKIQEEQKQKKEKKEKRKKNTRKNLNTPIKPDNNKVIQPMFKTLKN